MQTAELTGAALDWAVATIEGYTELHRMEDRWSHEPNLAMYQPCRDYGIAEMWQLGFSSDWAKGGPIIERNNIQIGGGEKPNGDTHWFALKVKDDKSGCYKGHGPTLLIAAMRCYVASKIGDSVEIPTELQGI